MTDIYDASNDNQVKEAETKRRLAREQEIEDLKAILATQAGIRFFKRLMADGHVFKTTFTGNSQGYFLEGHRNLALKYFSDVCEAAPHVVKDLMLREQTNDTISRSNK